MRNAKIVTQARGADARTKYPPLEGASISDWGREGQNKRAVQYRTKGFIFSGALRFWVRLCRPLPKGHFTDGHTKVPSLERFLLSRVSEHHQCKRGHLIDTNSTNPFYFGKKGKRSFFRGPEGGPPG